MASLFYYRDLKWRRIPQLLLNAFMTSATVMLVIATTGAMALPAAARHLHRAAAGNAALGAALPAAAKRFNMEMVHIGVVMTANLAIALYTPPVGGTLFVAAKPAKAGIGEITKSLWPLMAATFTAVLLVTYLPWPSLWLPRFIQTH